MYTNFLRSTLLLMSPVDGRLPVARIIGAGKPLMSRNRSLLGQRRSVVRFDLPSPTTRNSGSADSTAGRRLLRRLLRRRLPLQSGTNACSVVGVHLVEQRQLTPHDSIGNPGHRLLRDVREQALPLACVEQIEQGARLAEVVVADPVIVAVASPETFKGGSATSARSTGPPNELGS
jgi:hypothetical protein